MSGSNTGLTVAALIERLQALPPDASVWTYLPGTWREVRLTDKSITLQPFDPAAGGPTVLIHGDPSP